jgi:hypothetical protein
MDRANVRKGTGEKQKGQQGGICKQFSYLIVVGVVVDEKVTLHIDSVYCFAEHANADVRKYPQAEVKEVPAQL